MKAKFQSGVKRSVVIGGKEFPVIIPVEIQVDVEIDLQNMRVCSYHHRQESGDAGFSAAELTADLTPEDFERLKKFVLEDIERHIRSPIVIQP